MRSVTERDIKILHSREKKANEIPSRLTSFKNKFPSGWSGLLLDEPLTRRCSLESTKLLSVKITLH